MKLVVFGFIKLLDGYFGSPQRLMRYCAGLTKNRTELALPDISSSCFYNNVLPIAISSSPPGCRVSRGSPGPLRASRADLIPEFIGDVTHSRYALDT